MSYSFPTLLTFGLPLLAVPLLIHLINLRRRRKIEWAAMDFLLQSQKRNKKWVVLKQLLLLLLRTAAIACIVGMLAGPVIRSGWAKMLGGSVTHHIVLLDDSYSMSDRWGKTTALEEAKRSVQQILEQAARQSTRQIVTIIPFSEAARLSVGTGPEIDGRPLDDKFLADLKKQLDKFRTSESDAGPAEALQAAMRLPEAAAEETRFAYLISDFRRRQWEEETQLQQLFTDYRKQVNQLRLVQCVSETRPNLAITRLEPESGLRAAGVETWFETEVANYSDSAASGVIVQLQVDDAKLPVMQFDEIPAGETVKRRFRATFPTAGPHQMTARLESDAVAIDNTRYFAAAIPKVLPVLIIDASQRGDDGYYLSMALSPGGKNVAGWSPQIEGVEFLRKHAQLNDFAAIFLLDVPRLDQPEVDALQDYVENGGGLGIFLGPRVQPRFYNESLYRDAQGLLPRPLDVPTQLLATGDAAVSDVEVSEHPIFKIFTGQRNSFLALAKINFYYGVAPSWQAGADDPSSVLASLRNDAPLVVEKPFGEGRVVLQLGKLSPRPTDLGVWSNWGVNPMFPIYANELTGYLSAAKRHYDAFTSGEALQLSVAESKYDSEAKIVAPTAASLEPAVVSAQADEGRCVFTAPAPASSGVWKIDLTRRANKRRKAAVETRVVAVNVPIGEDDLHTLGRAQIAEKLPGLDYQFSLASQLGEGREDLAGTHLGDLLLYSLLATLLVEQLVAVAASYHGGRVRSAA